MHLYSFITHCTGAFSAKQTSHSYKNMGWLFTQRSSLSFCHGHRRSSQKARCFRRLEKVHDICESSLCEVLTLRETFAVVQQPAEPILSTGYHGKLPRELWENDIQPSTDTVMVHPFTCDMLIFTFFSTFPVSRRLLNDIQPCNQKEQFAIVPLYILLPKLFLFVLST